MSGNSNCAIRFNYLLGLVVCCKYLIYSFVLVGWVFALLYAFGLVRVVHCVVCFA